MYDDHQSPSHLQYSWSSPTMRANGQSHQTLQAPSHQTAFHVPSHTQVYPPPYYQHMVQALPPHPGHPHALFWNNTLPVSPESKSSHPYYSYSQYPSSPSNLFHYLDPFPPSTQQPSCYTNGSHIGSPRIPYHNIVTNAHSTKTSTNNKSGVLRGPPRKPRQSGHALWVGNLPFTTDIIKLKEHFSTAATATIESVFWISKSKSAFVNYRTSEALLGAMQRFHDSKFEGVRLVCRIRSTGVPTSTASTTAARAGDGNKCSLSLAVEGFMETTNGGEKSPEPLGVSEVNMKAPVENNAKRRFFVMKSLATEDLESSVLNGRWVTQEHNERALNEAFVSADEVYLIFSANKSGEYFGYARMQALIGEHSPQLRLARLAEEVSKNSSSDMPEIVLTPGTAAAPGGAVFIDVYRGTIFWEADIASQDDPSLKLSAESDDVKTRGVTADPSKDKEWNPSRPFEVKWISTSRLPFYRTKGLKNPWNANREVKIARDGTELETNVGIRLLELFQQNVMPVTWDSNCYSPGGFQAQSPV